MADHTSRSRRLAMLLAAAALGLGPAGCYEHVIRAEGFGTDDIDTYQPDRPEPGDNADQLFWGDKTQKDLKTARTPKDR